MRRRVRSDQRPRCGVLAGCGSSPGSQQEAGEAITATIGRGGGRLECWVGEELITLDTSYSHKRLRIFIVHLCRLCSRVTARWPDNRCAWTGTPWPDFPFPAKPTAGSWRPCYVCQLGIAVMKQ